MWSIYSCYHWFKKYENRIRNTRVIVENMWFYFMAHRVRFQSVICTSCAQTLYALRVLRLASSWFVWKRTTNSFQSSRSSWSDWSAWWRFASVTDRHKRKVFIRRSILAGFYTPGPDYDFEQYVMKPILKSQSHLLEQLLPPTLWQSYNFRKRPHTRQIPYRCSYLTDCNFLIRMLFADSYWCCCFPIVLMSVLCLYKFACTILIFVTAVCQFSMNEYYY